MQKIFEGFFLGDSSSGSAPAPQKSTGGNPYIRIISEANQCTNHSEFLRKLGPLSSKTSYDKDLVLQLFNKIIRGEPLPQSNLTVSQDELTDNFYTIHNLLKAEKLIEHLQTLKSETEKNQVWLNSKAKFGLTLEEFIQLISEDKNLELLNKKGSDRSTFVPVTSDTTVAIIDACSNLSGKALDGFKKPLKEAIKLVAAENKVQNLHEWRELKVPVDEKIVLEALQEGDKTNLKTLIRELKSEVSRQLLEEHGVTTGSWDENLKLYGLGFKEAVAYCRSAEASLPQEERLAFNVLDVSRTIKGNRFLENSLKFLPGTTYEKTVEHLANPVRLSDPKVLRVCLNLAHGLSDKFLESLTRAVETINNPDELIPLIRACLEQNDKRLIPLLQTMVKKVVQNNLTLSYDEFLKKIGDIKPLKKLLGDDFLVEAAESDKADFGKMVLLREIHFSKFFDDFINDKLKEYSPHLFQELFKGNAHLYYGGKKPFLTEILNIYKKLPEEQRTPFLAECVNKGLVPEIKEGPPEMRVALAFQKLLKKTLLNDMSFSMNDFLTRTDLIKFMSELEKVTNTKLIDAFNELDKETTPKNKNFYECYEQLQSIESIKNHSRFKEKAPISPQAVEHLLNCKWLPPQEKIELLNYCMSIPSINKLLINKAERMMNVINNFIGQPPHGREAFITICKDRYGVTLDQALNFITWTNLISNDAAFNVFEQFIQIPSLKDEFLEKCENGLNENFLGFKRAFETPTIITKFNPKQISEDKKLLYAVFNYILVCPFRKNVSREQLTKLCMAAMGKDHPEIALLNESKARTINKLSDIVDVNDILFLSDTKIDSLLRNNGIYGEQLFGKKLDAGYFKMALLAQLFMDKEKGVNYYNLLKAYKKGFAKSLSSKTDKTADVAALEEAVQKASANISDLPDLINASRQIFELFTSGNIQAFTDNLVVPFTSGGQTGREGRDINVVNYAGSIFNGFKKFNPNYESFIGFTQYQNFKVNISGNGGWETLNFAPNGDFISGEYRISYKTQEGETKSDVIQLNLSELEDLPSKQTMNDELSKLQSGVSSDLPEDITPLQKIVADFGTKILTLSNKLRFEILDWT